MAQLESKRWICHRENRQPFLRNTVSPRIFRISYLRVPTEAHKTSRILQMPFMKCEATSKNGCFSPPPLSHNSNSAALLIPRSGENGPRYCVIPWTRFRARLIVQKILSPTEAIFRFTLEIKRFFVSR